MTILEKGALVVNNQGCEARVLRLEGKAEHMLKMVESYKQVIGEPLYREMVESILEFEGVGI